METQTNITKNSILEPLNLNTLASTSDSNAETVSLNCIFCDHSEKHELNQENKAILQHMYHEHRLVIADIHEVADLVEYLRFWQNAFKGKQLFRE